MLYGKLLENILSRVDNKLLGTTHRVQLDDCMEIAFREHKDSQMVRIRAHVLYNSQSYNEYFSENVDEIIAENTLQGKYSLFFVTDGYQSIGRFNNHYQKINGSEYPKLSKNEKKVQFTYGKNRKFFMEINQDILQGSGIFDDDGNELDIITYQDFSLRRKKKRLKQRFRNSNHQQYTLLIPYGNFNQPVAVLPHPMRTPRAEQFYQAWKTQYVTPVDTSLLAKREDKAEKKEKERQAQKQLTLFAREEEISQNEKAKREALREMNKVKFDKANENLGIEYPESIVF